MKVNAAPILLILLSLLISPFCIHAQEENATAVTQGNRYISFKLKSIDKYNSRIERQQKQLLNKLKIKEKHFEHKLKNSDSLAYAHYKEQKTPSYDSISKLSKSDTGSTAASFSKHKNATVDSLRGVQSFVQSKSGLPANAPQVQGATGELNNVQGKMNFRNYITQLITQHTNSLKSLAGTGSDIPGLKGIEKQVYYSNAKMGVYKEMEENPTKAEDKALEYLEGTEGFDKTMKNSLANSDIQGAGTTDPTQLANMGVQSNQLIQKSLQQKFGPGMGAVTKSLCAQLSQWQDKQKDITGSINESKQSLKNVKNIDKPSFKVNSMRGLPFWKRIQKQYSWQNTRVSGTQPTMIQPSAMAGFKQTPNLTYGLGIATAIGLGQSWQNVHFTYQGIGVRSFTTWQWQYGIGLYAGYERMYNQFAFSKKVQNPTPDVPGNTHNTADYNESLLLGLTKTYHMNNKYDGQVQVLYDIWWREKGLRSPFFLRFATMKK